MILAAYNNQLGTAGAFYGLLFVPYVFLHFVLASAVFSDARRLPSQTGRGTFLVGPGIWWLATILGGLVALAIYWTIHHSRLRAVKPPISRRMNSGPTPDSP